MHTTVSGDKIPLSEMSDGHLRNAANMLRAKSERGIRAMSGYCEDSVDEEWIFGEEALKRLGFARYEKELRRRGLANP